MKKIIAYLLLPAAAFLVSGLAYPGAGKEGKIKWHTFSEAIMLMKKSPKKVFVDVYTGWCGWCKKMDAGAFENEEVAKYMNEKYYAVKLDAEMKDTVVFNNFTFVNPNPSNPRSVHQLAASLLSNKMSYPTTVYLDENFGMLQAIPGYLDAKTLEMILNYFGEGANKTTSWEDYQATFKGKVK